MADLYNLFPVPIVSSFYNDSEDLKQVLCPKFKEYEINNPIDNKYSPYGYTSYYNSDNILLWDECKELLDIIGNEVVSLHQKAGLSGSVYLENSWFSVNRQGSYHDPHCHIPSIWSGCYYVQSNVDQDAKISFLNNNHYSNWPFVQKLVANEYNSSSTTFSVETGTLLIFPSYILHKVEQQLSSNDRITIAFNFNSKGESLS